MLSGIQRTRKLTVCVTENQLRTLLLPRVDLPSNLVVEDPDNSPAKPTFYLNHEEEMAALDRNACI